MNKPRNVALTAHASAFESYQAMTPDLANDGSTESRWSGIPGHNAGGWYELDWDQPVKIAEVIIFQYDRFVNELDVQVFDHDAKSWLTLRHFGQSDRKLPRVVVFQTVQTTTQRLRLANITGGPSFTEVQVFDTLIFHSPSVNMASDANGNFIGMVSDEWGDAPLPGTEISLSGDSKSGSWQSSTRSDERGLFFAPMPVGLDGTVTVITHIPPHLKFQNDTTTWDAAGFQYGLTPSYLRATKTILNGGWRFAPDPPDNFWKSEFDDSHWARIKVPAHAAMEGFCTDDGIGGYRNHFRANAGSDRLILRFEGVYSGAELWVNSRRLAYHEGGALPFEADITDAVQDGDNVLAVRVTQHTVVSDHLDKMSEYADFPLMGIIRPVYLFRVPAVHIGALELATIFDSKFHDAEIKGHLTVLNKSDEAGPDVTAEMRLLDRDGKTVCASTKTRPINTTAWKRTEINFSLPVASPRQWEAEHPNLYTLQIVLNMGKRTIDRLAQRVGFRQTDIVGNQLLINGRPVKIRGSCHHDSHPLMGRAVTAELTRQDLELMKEANLNSLRTSHYPPLPELLDIADELGIYVEDEGSFCWADVSDDLRLTPRIMQLNAELLARDRNHPSVFLWSICNESSFGYGFERSHEWMRMADPSRPDAGSYDPGSLEVRARHNPITPADIAGMEKLGKPVLWDESWCIYQGIWNDVAEMWVDPGIRDYYAEPLPAIYDLMMQSRNILGTQIWAWSDDIFCLPLRGLEYGRGATSSHFIENEYYMPGRGLVGDAPWGVVDGWRRKKPEFWITKKLHSPIRIKETPLPLPPAGRPINITVENQYDFTDLSELAVHWKIGSEKGSASVSIPPHMTGTIGINTVKPVRTGDILMLEFVNAKGGLVDAYELPIARYQSHMPALDCPAPAPLRILRESYLSGQNTCVTGRDFQLAFDQSTGALRRAVFFGKTVMLELPRIHLLPSATPESPMPTSLSWRLRDMRIEPDGANVRVRIQGSYNHFDGEYDVLITPNGELKIHSSFSYSGDTLTAREVGMVFSVPRDCDLLRWERRGEWSVYAGDHIGRTFGETRAFARHADRVPPTWSWAEDNSPMGSNDFRSTKRHIYWASISYPHGPGVWVESDGFQHARAMVENDRISLHINDWYGGTNTGLWEWTSNYGEGRKLAPGQTFESNLHLRIAKIKQDSKRK